jgi:hypothetical protein
MIDLSSGTQIWIAAGVTDLRRGFTGLSAVAQEVLKKSPFFRTRVRFSGSSRRLDQAAVVGWRWAVFVCQAAGARTIRLAASGEWHGLTHTRAAIDVA